MPFRRSTVDLFKSWHDGQPHKEVRLNTDFAPYYVKLDAPATEIWYWSNKWVQAGDVASNYHHPFRGAPAHVWVPANGADAGARRLDVPRDVAFLGDVLGLELEDGQSFDWSRGTAHMVGLDRSRIAIATRARYIPIIISNIRVTPDGLDDVPRR